MNRLDLWYQKRIKELGYEGCRNCTHKTEDCKEHAELHLICPRWEKRNEDN